MKGYLFLLLFFCLGWTACEKCFYQETNLELSFINKASGEKVYPVFNRVYGLGADENLTEGKSPSTIPINFSSDSTILIFEKDGESDTLAISYERLMSREGSAYCIQLINENIMSSTTFEVRCFSFEGTVFTPFSRCKKPYEIQIYY